MTARGAKRGELLAIEMSAGRFDEFGPTPDEIIRRMTDAFAKDMAQIMGSAAVAQAGAMPRSKARRVKAQTEG